MTTLKAEIKLLPHTAQSTPLCLHLWYRLKLQSRPDTDTSCSPVPTAPPSHLNQQTCPNLCRVEDQLCAKQMAGWLQGQYRTLPLSSEFKRIKARAYCSLKQQLHRLLLVPFVYQVGGFAPSPWCTECPQSLPRVNTPSQQLPAARWPLRHILVAKILPGGRLARCCARRSRGRHSSSGVQTRHPSHATLSSWKGPRASF